MLEIFKKLKEHVHHLIFVVSLLSLAALVAWWSVFIQRSIQQQLTHQYQILKLELDILSLKLGADGNNQPISGPLQEDERFEVGQTVPEDRSFAQRLTPFWPDFWIHPRAKVLAQIEKEKGRLNLMLVGEASLLILIVLISSVFLYRFIQIERRTTLEVKEFWERSAHEIKTPITGLKAFLQNLKSGKNLDEILPHIHLALKQVEKQEKLAENILSGYYLKSKGRELKLGELDLSRFLVRYLSKGPIQLTKIKVNIDFDPDQPLKVQADAHGLKVILDNIMDNAVKYGPPEPVLTFDIKKEGKKTHIMIQDNGPGLSARQTTAIFQAYKKLDAELPVRKKGTGMGLYISKNLARNMDGDLKAFSRGRGCGARFQITLSRIQGHDT